MLSTFHVYTMLVGRNQEMTNEEYKESVLRTVNHRMTYEQFWAMASLGLVGECGEVVDIVKKHIYHEHVFDHDKFKDEMGDVFYYFVLLLHLGDVTMDEVMQHNKEKLQRRYPNGFDPRRSQNRLGSDYSLPNLKAE